MLQSQPGPVQAGAITPQTALPLATIAQARPMAAEFNITVDQIVASGFSRPVQVTHAGDGSGRLFVVEQDGRIKIISNTTVLPTPFLDINTIVRSPADGGGPEEGLLGLAFHPNYESNGFFYIYYNNTNSDIVIARYSVSGNPNQANSGSGFNLLTIPHPTNSNHNGGQLLFSPLDGYLYIGTGDGGSGGDPNENAQNKNILLGKMLRINVDSGSPYGIPAGNPFQGATPGLDEIWALGLRNPWRFSFDRGSSNGNGKGDLYIGDVGQNNWEEISYQAGGTPGGVNFGWDCREGAHNFEYVGGCTTAILTDPIAEYDHSLGSAVTGGFVYRGSQYPALAGYYFYADYGSGRLWSMTKTGPTSWSTPEQELDAPFLISAFGEDEQGELYVVDYNNGRIRRLADVNGPAPNLSASTKNSSTPHADPGEVVTYTIRINNTGGLSNQTVFLTDTIPAGLTYVAGSFTATLGAVNAASAPTLYWQGPLSPTQNITLTYRVTVNPGVSGSLVNQARLTGAGLSPLTLTHAIFAPRPVVNTTVNDFFFPGTQPDQITQIIPDPAGCDFCHTEPIYDRWRGSMMSQAGRDPIFWAALAVANQDAANAGEYCLRCHTPKGWLESRSQPADGSALQTNDLQAGVACETCHRMVDPAPTASDETASFDGDIRAGITPPLPSGYVGSAMMIVDPQDRRRGPFSLTAPHTAFRSNFLGQGGDAVTESRLCGTCHNVDNPALSWNGNSYQLNPLNLAAPSFNNGDLFPIERTYDEWLNSTYAAAGVYAPQFAGAKPDGMVRSCQDCHMRRLTGATAEAQYNPVNRNCTTNGCLPGHDLAGGNTWAPLLLQDSRWRLHSSSEAAYLNNTILRAREMLQKAATLTVTLSNGNAIVRVTNETGHKLPTGYPEGRRIWINLRAYDANNALIYESGAYNPATGVLIQDPAIKIYEAKHGLSADLAAQLNLPAGESFHFVLNNTIVKDNRIPPRGFTAAALAQRGLSPVGATYSPGQYWDETTYPVPPETEWVAAALYYQTSSKEYIDFLRSQGGVDGFTLGALWDSSKSPPEVMAVASSRPIYLPLIFK
jgi:uncharacterized repeat protein (TIGR01451 family)